MCALVLPLLFINNESSIKQRAPTRIIHSILKDSDTKPRVFKKTVQFQKIAHRFPKGNYIAMENYEDRIADIAQFEETDERRVAYKVRDLIIAGQLTLGRGLPTRYRMFENGQAQYRLTVSEVLMWRRLAMHDWSLEEAIVSPVVKTEKRRFWKRLGHFIKTSILGKRQVGKEERVRQSSIYEIRAVAVGKKELGLISRTRNLSACARVVNSCMTCGEMPFSEKTIRQLCNIPISADEKVALHLQQHFALTNLLA